MPEERQESRYHACSVDALEGNTMTADQIVRYPHTSRLKERFRRLGWFTLWIVAEHSVGLWLAEQAVTRPQCVSPDGRRGGR
jgi:hypothetical protein